MYNFQMITNLKINLKNIEFKKPKGMLKMGELMEI